LKYWHQLLLIPIQPQCNESYASDIGLQLSANTKIIGTVPLVTDALVKMMGASTTVADDSSANGTNGCYEKQCCQPTKLNKSWVWVSNSELYIGTSQCV
jgi:hypothetical protein